MPNKGLSVVGIVLVVIGLLCLAAALGLSLAPLTVVSYEGPLGNVTIGGIPLPLATALWMGVVLIILGIGCLALSAKF
jgi:ABC-type transport system involved in multi-copper enzyme maturation permease subunit